MSSTSATHILVFPYPAQGHMLPLLDLTHQLSLRGLIITILVTPNNLPTLTSLLSANPSIQTLLLPFPPHPQLPQGVENVKDIGNAGNLPIINALAKLHDPLLHWFTSHPSPPVAIISDFFLGWTLRLAHQLNLPRIAFFSSGAFLASVLDYLWRQDAEALRSLPAVDFADLPGSPSLKQEHLPSLWRFYRESDPDTKFLKDGVLANFASWGCIFNSFHQLEGRYLDYLSRRLMVIGGQDNARVYGVGPLSLVGIITSNGNPEEDPHSAGIMSWLDACPDAGSVLYVCFGSQKLLNKQQVEALASGLQKSGTRFIWVVKTGTEAGFVPEGFEELVGERGLIIKGWAPQVTILSHRAVGGFLSHCGWNSVLEGIVGGAMILGWPMEADQFVNARLLVEEMGVAVRVCEGAHSVPDPEHLARVIDESMVGDTAMKVRAKEVRDKAFEAVTTTNGSSSRDLDALVKHLEHLPPPTLPC